MLNYLYRRSLPVSRSPERSKPKVDKSALKIVHMHFMMMCQLASVKPGTSPIIVKSNSKSNKTKESPFMVVSDENVAKLLQEVKHTEKPKVLETEGSFIYIVRFSLHEFGTSTHYLLIELNGSKIEEKDEVAILSHLNIIKELL